MATASSAVATWTRQSTGQKVRSRMNSVSMVTDGKAPARAANAARSRVLVMTGGMRVYTRRARQLEAPRIWIYKPPLTRAAGPGVRDDPARPRFPDRDKGPAVHPYRTHTCGELRVADAGIEARLSGWVHRKRDHGNLLFVDLRDHYGLTQCVIEASAPGFDEIAALRLETVICVTGRIERRSEETRNESLPTGEVELRIAACEVLGESDPLPLEVNSDRDYGEEVRLRYRFLDLRRARVHDHIMLRSRVIASIRTRMIGLGFTEFQTPILTSSSPEGARDFLVPSRLHAGRFYALPQAPQQFKQLIMVAGFDRYFQIAPCFRDEDARADRSPGEFYQLDIEMSFATQEDVLDVVERLLHGLFEEFRRGARRVGMPVSEDQLRGRDGQVRHRQAGSPEPDRDARRHRRLPGLGLPDLRRHGRRRRRRQGVGDSGSRRRIARLLRTA